MAIDIGEALKRALQEKLAREKKAEVNPSPSGTVARQTSALTDAMKGLLGETAQTFIEVLKEYGHEPDESGRMVGSILSVTGERLLKESQKKRQ